MNLFDLDAKVSATAVAAAGTVIGALAQLRMAWRKEVAERARGVPATKKSRRGPVLAVFLLLAAAMVAGFVLSQYLMSESNRESAALRGDLQAQVARISATAERLERATVRDDEHHAAQTVIVTTTVGPCRAGAAGTADATPICSEQEALRVTICGTVPSSAMIVAAALYARPDNSQRPWSENRVAPGQDIGGARFADKTFERSESEQLKQVCTLFSAWDGEQAYSARLVVTYGASPAAPEADSPPAVATAAVATSPVATAAAPIADARK